MSSKFEQFIYRVVMTPRSGTKRRGRVAISKILGTLEEKKNYEFVHVKQAVTWGD